MIKNILDYNIKTRLSDQRNPCRTLWAVLTDFDFPCPLLLSPNTIIPINCRLKRFINKLNIQILWNLEKKILKRYLKF